ncbi:MAG: hypothetical protein RL522_1057 [Pseudomonadota bacterium]|jgi:DNA-binding transcriptional LysR family regulator
MMDKAVFDKLDFHLIRVMHTVLTERSVSRAALVLGMHQPAVSAALRRLREVARDPLLVRSGAGMVPTDVGLRMIEPAADMLRAAEALFSNARGFDPATDSVTFRVAASDYLGPQLVPRLVANIRSRAPHCHIELYPLVDRIESYRQLARDELDVVLINWFDPTDDLHASALFEDEVACLVSEQHPAVKSGWTAESWVAADHVRPLQISIYSRSLIDARLEQMGLVRDCVVHCPHFGLIPAMVAQSQLVLTAGRRFFERYTDHLPVVVLPCPVDFPRMVYYQVWHTRTETSGAGRWLREQIYEAAADLRLPQR